MLVRWLAALLAALIIPVVGFGASMALTATVEAEWRAIVIEQLGSLPPELESTVALGVLCKDPAFRAEVPNACTDPTVLDLLRTASLAAGGLAILVLAIAGATAVFTRGSQRRMAAVFRPALVLVLLTTAALLVLQAVIVIGVIWEVMTVWLHRIWPWLLVVLGLAGATAVFGVLVAIVDTLRITPLPITGLALDRTRQPRLFAEVDSIAQSIGAPAPDRIVAGLEPSFFVVDAPVAIEGEVVHGRTMFLSVPTSRILSVAELRAVIGHELGHFRGDDTTYTRRISPMYAAARSSLGSLAGTRGHWSGAITIPASLLLAVIFNTLAAGVAQVSRSRELAADTAGAEASSPAALGSALRKLPVASLAWDETAKAMFADVRMGRQPAGLGAAFVTNVRAADAREATQRAGNPHPFDSHPPTGLRLAHVGLDPAAPVLIDLAPEPASSTLLEDPGAIEDAITAQMLPRVREVVRQRMIPIYAGPSRAIREACQADDGIAAVVAMVMNDLGADLTRPVAPDGRWVVLADLLVAADDTPHRSEIAWSIRPSEIAGLTMVAIRDVADAGDPAELTLQRGVLLTVVGASSIERRSDGWDELVLTGDPGSPWAERLVIVRGVCPKADVRAQAAGLLLLPPRHLLAAAAGPIADEVAGVAARLLATRAPATADETASGSIGTG